MINTATINIWGKQVGAIAWNSDTNIASFEYDPDFLKNQWDLSPLKMPHTQAENKIYSFNELRDSNTFKGIPGLIADVMPDKYGNTLINAWLAQRGRPSDSMNPVEILCFVGKRGMGALEFEPTVPKGNNTASKIELDSLINTAQQILSSKEQFGANLEKDEEKALLDILKIGTSAGGARAKAVIAYNPLTNEVRSGQADAPEGFSHWLIKFDGVADAQLGTASGYGKVEMAYHLMAVDCGIEMTECRIIEENNRAHFITKRFDRTAENKKIHLQSFCALTHYDFQDIYSYSYEQIFETMRVLHLPYLQAEQLYRRMVFNVLARNCDDHTKNFAFMMDKDGVWKLSPAYDICHAYRPGSAWVSQHALSMNGKRTDINRDDLLSVAKQMNIKKANTIINQIYDVVQKWPEYAEKTSVNTKLLKAIYQTLIKV
ncbi:MAG: type II toxin-antitoxin system HipA family toxin [Bacteroidota bacterium]|nr:type II toxin-antitoxin system HipA family toxin [Bacteroidota bacterium]